MFYPGIFLVNSCSSANVEIVNDSSNHVGRYASDLPLYVVLQICQSLGLFCQGFPTWGTCTPRSTFAYLKGYI